MGGNEMEKRVVFFMKKRIDSVQELGLNHPTFVGKELLMGWRLKRRGYTRFHPELEC